LVWWCKTTERKCSLCNRTILLSDNLSGLVFNDEHFLCEDCSKNEPEDDLIDWAKTVMQDPNEGMPIALWLIHEQNKDKTMMSACR
jgi:hypothetical protein